MEQSGHMAYARDTLAGVGAGLGALLVIIGIATVLGQPWTTNSLAGAGVKVFGGIVAVVIGVGLAWLALRD
jgi:hypothetical protein